MDEIKLTQEESADTTRWNLQHIPKILDQAVRIRQIRNREPYICHQVVKDLLRIYGPEIEELRVLGTTIDK